MKKEILSSSEKVLLHVRLAKVYDDIVRNKDIDNINMRVDLVDLRDYIDNILAVHRAEYEEKY